MKFYLLISMKMPTIFAEKFSCSAMFSKKELAIVCNLRFISRTNFIFIFWFSHLCLDTSMVKITRSNIRIAAVQTSHVQGPVVQSVVS